MPDIETILKAKQEHIDAMHVCQPGRTALVVVDMQHGFLDEGASLEVPPGREIVPNIARLIATCRGKNCHRSYPPWCVFVGLDCRWETMGLSCRVSGSLWSVCFVCVGYRVFPVCISD